MDGTTEDGRTFKNIYQVEILGDKGCWLDIVIAEDEKDMIKKVNYVFGNYHKELKVNVLQQYDYYID